MRQNLLAASLLALALAPRPAAANEAEVARAKAKLAAEPEVRAVVDRVLEHFRVDPGAVSRLRTAANARGLLPIVATGFRYDANATDQAQTGFFSGSPVDLSDKSDARLRAFTVGGVWDLRELVFNPAEVQVYGLIGVQRDLMLEVTRIYYQRRQLALRLLVRPPEDPIAAESLRMRVDELTAQLDAYTGGWFSETIRSAGGVKK